MNARRLRPWIILALLGVSLLLPGASRRLAAQATAPIAPELQTALASAAPDDLLPILIELKPTAALQPTATQPRAQWIAAMQSDFAHDAASLTEWLTTALASGDAADRRDLWIIHGLALRAKPRLIRELAARPEVQALRLDRLVQYLEQPPATRDVAAPAASPWGVERIGAPEVWAAQAISGTGAVVAIMDTGVEYDHPALRDAYRGNLGGGHFDHSAAWYDPINGGVYPYDDYSHGTHVAGTAVGSLGIGVAPGAQWIAVKCFNNAGGAYDSWIHAGFQWLLAPNGDPTLAPDVVNASWSNRLGESTVFSEDLALLKAAGIFPVIAAGNEGPYASSVGSPASLPGIFAVGASDPDEAVAYFSGRGPSPWEEIKPAVVAPGVNTLSSVPGGIYQLNNGTSMATPHVVGLVALMRGVSPTVSIAEIARLITRTAVPLGATVPNHDSGWGRIDAPAALLALTHAAVITGVVREFGGAPLPWAEVTAVAHAQPNRVVHVAADAQGRYRLILASGSYEITASAFGYAAYTEWGVRPERDGRMHLDFELNPLPGAVVQGHITVAGTSRVPTATVRVLALNTPITATADSAGRYAISLPTGRYTLEVRAVGYRLLRQAVQMPPAGTLTVNFALQQAPRILLVDGEAWQYQSQTRYWQAALEALAYGYADFAVKSFDSATALTTETLRTYDIVLWSSPTSAPGIGGHAALLEDYLRRGGKLLLSGQDIAFYDDNINQRRYLSHFMSVLHQQDDGGAREVVGQGPFAGLHLPLNADDSAANQTTPDAVLVRDSDIAMPLWTYSNGRGAGIGASTCVTYRAAFFAFGYEALGDTTTRREVLSRTLAWLTAPPPTTGFTLHARAREQLWSRDGAWVGAPGATVTHTLRLRHIGAAGVAELVTAQVNGQRWPTEISPTQARVAPCQWITLTVRVHIPADAAKDAQDAVTVTLTPERSQPVALVLRTKTPAALLLVDDDRWYEMEGRYMDALKANAIPYDVWSTQHAAALLRSTSPDLPTLNLYPMVIWFTGYDWYEPLTTAEVIRLASYLNAGGKLLLSSQEFLYAHASHPLRKQLGVLTWRENTFSAPKTAWGVATHPAGGDWGPVRLDYPFTNWADAPEPQPGAQVVMRGQHGQPIGIAAATGAGRSLFFGFPLETLPLAERTAALEHSVGWLSPLGQSRWSVTPNAVPGAEITACARLVNDAATALAVRLTHTLPPSLTLLPETLPSGASYDAARRQITWEGTLAPAAALTLTWQAQIGADTSADLALPLRLTLPDWGLSWERPAQVRIYADDLANSGWAIPATLLQSPTPTLYLREAYTLNFVLRNGGSTAANAARADFWLAPGLTPLTVTLPPTHGYALTQWIGPLPAGVARTITVPLRAWVDAWPLRVDALLSDEAGRRWEHSLWLTITPRRIYLPLALKRE